MFGLLTVFKVPLNRVTKLIFIILASLGENNSIERNSIQNLLYFSICPHLVLKFRFSHLGSQFQYLHLNSKLQYNHLLSQSLSVQLKFKISVSALTFRIPLAAYLSLENRAKQFQISSTTLSLNVSGYALMLKIIRIYV